MTVQILHGHAGNVLRTLPAGHYHCCVTSPPFWGLRSYLPVDHPLKPFEIGCETSLASYVENIVACLEEVRRVLRKDGTLWLNLGDTYANDKKWGGSTGGKHVKALHGGSSLVGRGRRVSGLKSKDLCGVPWRVAFALQDAGWYLRSDIVWDKPTAMPESVRDRPTKSHEYIFLLSKTERYFYDATAVRESSQPADGAEPAQRNKRSVWRLNAARYEGAHYATFPTELVRPCILAGTSERGCCPTCGAPWLRELAKAGEGSTGGGARKRLAAPAGEPGHPFGHNSTFRTGRFNLYLTKGWRPSCKCPAHEPVPCRVLDPFGGSGTTAHEAETLGRHSTLIELNPESIPLAEERTAQRGLFAQERAS